MTNYTKDFSYSTICRKSKKQADLDLKNIYNNLPNRPNFFEIKQLVQQKNTNLFKDEQAFLSEITTNDTQTTSFNLNSSFNSDFDNISI